MESMKHIEELQCVKVTAIADTYTTTITHNYSWEEVAGNDLRELRSLVYDSPELFVTSMYDDETWLKLDVLAITELYEEYYWLFVDSEQAFADNLKDWWQSFEPFLRNLEIQGITHIKWNTMDRAEQ